MTTLPRVYALSAHATWACRHSGACCSAGWPIPVEPERRERLGAAVLLPDATGRCTFHDPDARRCRVHRDHGEVMLPSACAQFPRRVLRDARGVFVNLSHFCPTAAQLLVESSAPLEVVERPSAFPASRDYDGLDGRDAWPPLVNADVLFDLPSYTRWERYLVATLDNPATADASPWDALREVAAAAEHLRTWVPDAGPFAARVSELDAQPWTSPERDRIWSLYQPLTQLESYERVRRCVPAGLQAPELSASARERWWQVEAASPLPARVARRYLAAKAFAAWGAYDTFGVRTLVAELVIAAVVLQTETARWLARAGADGVDHRQGGPGNGWPESASIEVVRAADWLLVHLVDRPSLIAWLGQVEQTPPHRPAGRLRTTS